MRVSLFTLGFGFSKHKLGQKCFSSFRCPTTNSWTQSRTQDSTLSQPSLRESTPSLSKSEFTDKSTPGQ